MSWVMADTVGQSEHHYSASLFPPHQGLYQHNSQAELFTSPSAEIWEEAVVGCGLVELSMKVTIQRPQVLSLL